MKRPAFKGILELPFLVWGLIQLPAIGFINRMVQLGVLHLTTGPGTQSLTFSLATSAMSSHTFSLACKAPWWPGLWCLPHHGYRPRLHSGWISLSLPFGKDAWRSAPIPAHCCHLHLISSIPVWTQIILYFFPLITNYAKHTPNYDFVYQIPVYDRKLRLHEQLMLNG